MSIWIETLVFKTNTFCFTALFWKADKDKKKKREEREELGERTKNE